MRDAIAVAARNAASSEPVRTTTRPPTLAVARIPAACGRTDACSRRTLRAVTAM
jgi:hypothetical protein